MAGEDTMTVSLNVYTFLTFRRCAIKRLRAVGRRSWCLFLDLIDYIVN